MPVSGAAAAVPAASFSAEALVEFGELRFQLVEVDLVELVGVVGEVGAAGRPQEEQTGTAERIRGCDSSTRRSPAVGEPVGQER